MNHTNCEKVKDDQTEIVEFLKKNRYYLLKLNRDMTVGEYINIQKKRGYLFSVVMRIDKKIVAHIAAYSSGGQKICRDHQVFLSTFVIDKQYRKALFSLGELYMTMIEVLSGMNYTEILLECGEKNKASMAIIRKFGGIMLTDETDLYHNYILHNYLFGIKESINFDISNAFKTKYRRSFANIRKISGENILLDEGKCVWQELQTPYGLLNLMIEISTGHVCGMVACNMSIIPDYESVKIQFNEGLSAKYVLYYMNKEGISKTILLEEGQNILKLPYNKGYETVNIEHVSSGLKCAIYFISKIEKTKELDLSDNISLDTLTGRVTFLDNDSPQIYEMLPCVEAPYNLGYIQPHIKELQIENVDNRYEICFDTEHTTVCRTYNITDRELVIDTKISFKSECIIEPILNLFMNDLGYQCTIYTDEGIITKTYDFDRDNSTGNEEVIFMDFRNEEYSCKKTRCIEIQYSQGGYKITLDRDYCCFHQYNYIGLKPLFDCNDTGSSKMIDLGKITIKKE